MDELCCLRTGHDIILIGEREGNSVAGEAMMEEFMGYEE